MHSSSRSRINSQLHTKSKTEEPLAVQVTELDKPSQSQKDTNEKQITETDAILKT